MGLLAAVWPRPSDGKEVSGKPRKSKRSIYKTNCKPTLGSPFSHVLDGLSVVGLDDKLAQTVNERGDDGLVDLLELNVLPPHPNVQVNVLQLFHPLKDLKLCPTVSIS